ncbi:hypothetical protein ACFX13_019202 [Malus domestica]
MVATREEMELRVFFGGGVGLSLELRVGGGENKRNLGVLEWGIRVCEQRKERLVRGTSFFFNLQGCFIFQTFCRSCGVQLQEVTPAAPRGRTSNSKGPLRLFPWLPRGRATPLTPLWLCLSS